ncbi:EamA-like transporter family protein [Planctomycetes bacterium Poly30]|uniref:EamA-like transporter family protein n=1 Tax=Saltatorellus ferox TaxID=2528018 RepID=A0A518ESU8_9BACT|nr:EamA-like transporter family protein [Planctomycetes bacterium Poly30]
MLLLVLASLLWSVSFALIKSSGIHPDVLSAARLGLAALLFVPLLVRGRQRTNAMEASSLAWKLIGIGAIQFGLMYVLVMRSYAFLAGHEVALLTVTTPIFIVLFEALLARRVAARAVLAAWMAVAAALVLRWPEEGGLGGLDSSGLLLVGAANAAWALGQILYRRVAPPGAEPGARLPLRLFGWMYVGAVAVAGPWAALHTSAADWQLDQSQSWKVLYLGLVPSGLAFYLWNRGAVDVGVGALAVMNNLKVPLAVAVALAPPFSESFDGARLGLSAVLLTLALGVATWRSGPHATGSTRP